MRRRLLALAAMGGAVAACFGVSEPPGGIASISQVLLPSPSVVRGDTMRDSTGAASPLRAYAFDQAGDTMKALVPTWIALGKRLHVDADGFVIGDTAGKDSVGVVATLGPVQTPPRGIIVTVEPTTITPGTLNDTIDFDPLASDTLSVGKSLTLTLTGPGDTAAVGFVVLYEITHGPPARDTAPAAMIVSGRARWARDTTDASGQVGRSAAINRNALESNWLSTAITAPGGTILDSITVAATVRTRGWPLSGNPLTYVVIVRRKGT